MDKGPEIYLRDIPWIDRPDADVLTFVERFQGQVSFNLLEKLTFWRENGYVVFEQVVDHAAIDGFVKDLELIRQNFHDYLISIEIKGKQTWSKAERPEVLDGPGVKFNHLHLSSIHAARLSLTREVTEFIQTILGSPAVPMQTLTFLKGSQQPTHIDYPYVRQQQRLSYMAASWIPLEDVQPDAGPLAYFPGAHKTDVSGFFDWGDGSIISVPESTRRAIEFAHWLDDRLAAADVKPLPVMLKKGDVLIWHCNMPHTGTKVLDETLTRKSHVTHYTDLNDYPPRWMPAGEKSTMLETESGRLIDRPWSKPEEKLPSWKEYFGLSQ